jgi:hypothetical protein
LQFLLKKEKKLSAVFFSLVFDHQALYRSSGLDPYPESLEMLDTDPYPDSMNPDPQLWGQHLLSGVRTTGEKAWHSVYSESHPSKD